MEEIKANQNYFENSKKLNANMEKKIKKKYEAPKITLEVVLIEESLSTGSVANINTGWDELGNENTPKETQWNATWETPYIKSDI